MFYSVLDDNVDQAGSEVVLVASGIQLHGKWFRGLITLVIRSIMINIIKKCYLCCNLHDI